MYAKKEKIYPAYISRYNSNLETEAILLTPTSVGCLWVYFEVWGSKITPCLKLVRINLETWNLVLKQTHIYRFGKYTF